VEEVCKGEKGAPLLLRRPKRDSNILLSEDFLGRERAVPRVAEPLLQQEPQACVAVETPLCVLTCEARQVKVCLDLYGLVQKSDVCLTCFLAFRLDC
jgi:hypothetical protein